MLQWCACVQPVWTLFLSSCDSDIDTVVEVSQPTLHGGTHWIDAGSYRTYACMYSRYDTWSSLLHGFGVINCNGCWLVSDSAVGLHPPRWMKSSVWMVLFFRAVYACVAWRRLPLVLVVSVSFVPVLPPYACYHDQTARLWRYACVCACVCLCATTV